MTADGGVGGRSFADLHCHSSASFDSLSAPRKLVERAQRIGLTHLAITDHERIDGALRARDLAPAGLTVIVQAIAVGTAAANGSFAASDAHALTLH